MGKKICENKLSAWRIFFKGLRIYCLNIHKLLGYMAFPVLGQLFGIILIFGLTFVYTSSLPDLIVRHRFFNSLASIVMCVIFIVLPGMLVWSKAFLDYLIAYGALNSMTEGALTTGRIYDFKAHTQTVTKRMFAFAGLWFLFGIFSITSFIPFFWVPGFILFVYFVLIFQIFIFEEKSSPIGCFVRSFVLIKGRFIQTLGLLAILFIFTYCLLPAGVSVVLAAFVLTGKFVQFLIPWVEALPLDMIYLPLQRLGIIISPDDIANFLNNSIINSVVIGFTLPLRSICCSLWYNELSAQGDLKNEKRERKQRSEKN